MGRRQEAIQFGLPDGMDLAVIAVEAGLGLDQALLRVGEEISIAHPELADELRLRNIEINMGRSRSEALRNLAERTGGRLIAGGGDLIQKLGGVVGTHCRAHSQCTNNADNFDGDIRTIRPITQIL